MNGDILDRVRAADPLAGRAVPDPTDTAAVAMREQIIAGQVDVVDLDARRRRRRRAIVGVAVAAVVAAAAAVAVTTRRPTVVTSIGCYTEASTAADTAVISAGSNPVDLCRELWEAGDMDPAITTPDGVPPLVACVLESGAVGVFPAASCDDVRTDGSGVVGPHDPGSPPSSPSAASTPPAGSPDPSPTDTVEPEGLSMPDFQTSDQELRLALNEIRLEMIDRCLTLEAATDLAEDILADHGFEGWTIEPIFEGHTDRTCAGFFPNAPERTIWWTPEEPTEDQTPGPR